MKIIVTELNRKTPRSHRRWTASFANNGQQMVWPTDAPEFRACLVLHRGIHSEPYDGPVSFFRPGETTPYLTVASTRPIANYGEHIRRMTPEAMFAVALADGELMPAQGKGEAVIEFVDANRLNLRFCNLRQVYRSAA